MREKGLGKIQEGFYGDYILIDGNTLEEISVLQDHDKSKVIVINGQGWQEGICGPTRAGQDSNSHHIGPNFPEVKDMQKNC